MVPRPAALAAIAAVAIVSCGGAEELVPGFSTVSTAELAYGGAPGSGGVGGNGATGAAGAGGQGGVAGQGGAQPEGGTGGYAGAGAAAGQATAGGAAGAWAGAAGEAGAAASAASAGAACGPSDPEPNNDIASAHDLGGVTDCDSDGATMGGVLDGAGDRDWYTLHGDDKFGCKVDPAFTVQCTEPVTLCAYFLCDSGGTVVTCHGASAPAVSVMGDKGCCGDVLSMSPSLDCTSTNEDSAQVWLEVSTAAQACVGYSIQYHY
jgi:hypothetical protein